MTMADHREALRLAVEDLRRQGELYIRAADDLEQLCSKIEEQEEEEKKSPKDWPHSLCDWIRPMLEKKSMRCAEIAAELGVNPEDVRVAVESDKELELSGRGWCKLAANGRRRKGRKAGG